MSSLKEKTLGFLGWGAIGFPICYGLVKSGYVVVLPTYRRETAQMHGFSDLVPDEKTKTEAIDWMLANGGKPSSSLRDMLEQIDILVLSLPKSQQVEEVILGKDGVLEVCKPGMIIIDMTSADAMSTKKIAKTLENKGIDILDAPVSGGTSGATAQNLTVMVGGKPAVFDKCRPILDTIGNPERVMYMGPSGSGNMIKCANNFLSACCAAATTEAVAVCARAGIDPRKAIEAISSSGGTSHAAEFKFPNIVFPGKNWNFSLGLMCKDIGLFNSAAKEMDIPALIGNLTAQLWGIPMAEEGNDADCINIQKIYEKWSGVQLCGLDKA
jgi:3-hydroxyisobutyrate dehydrogenase-like beta-hydroxyacid dehydrogenase